MRQYRFLLVDSSQATSTMRRQFYLFCTLLLFAFALPACMNKADKARSTVLVENLLTDLKNENYTSLDSYYTSSFNESEPQNEKIEKYKRLKELGGAMKSFEQISAVERDDSDRGLNELELKYKVHFEKVALLETFLVINDEGQEKIIFQNIENYK